MASSFTDRQSVTKSTGNRALSNARRAKQDEFYTQLNDIENELKHYRAQLRDKVILCNCDDPYESNFFRYFALNFNSLGLKKLIATSYVGSPIAGGYLPLPEMEGLKPEGKEPYAIEITEVPDCNEDGATDLADVEFLLRHDANTSRTQSGDDTYPAGDFRSRECIQYLIEADVVVTNPPFSLFREYVAQLIEHAKHFLIIGNKNAITHKEMFKLIRENRVWVGTTPMGRDMLFAVPDDVAMKMLSSGKEGSNYRIVDGVVYGRSPSIWFTNLDNPKRHERLPLYKKYDPSSNPKFDKYDVINVDRVSEIPADYDGPMGVPISFLDKYNPEQFEILDCNDYRIGSDVPYKDHGLIKDKDAAIGGKPTYARIVIRKVS